MKLDMYREGHLGGFIQGGDPGTWCPALWKWAIHKYGVRSMLDVGCGEGHSTKFFRDHGCEIQGIEGCQRAIDQSVVPGAVALHDFCHGPFRASRKYDLVWSCEFLEHVDRAYLPNILQTFDAAAKAIFVTHAFPGQEVGHHHVNCQPSHYWIRHIESLGFTCDVQATLEARTATLDDYHGINHFARSGLVFVRSSPAAGHGQRPLGGLATAWLKDRRINLGFKFSDAYRSQKRRRRKLKRLERQSQGVRQREAA